MKNYDVIVVGGGPAGLFAAGFAALFFAFGAAFFAVVFAAVFAGAFSALSVSSALAAFFLGAANEILSMDTRVYC